MSVPVAITKQLTSGVVNSVSLSQTPSAGNLLINGTLASGGVATFTTQRQVLFTFAADETGHNFVVYGTNDQGTVIWETVAGNATTAVTLLDYKTVTRITISANATGAMTVGTNGVGSTPWVIGNWQISPANLSIACVATGTVNYTVQYTYDDFYTVPPFNTAPAVPTAFDDATVAAKTANFVAVMNDPIRGWRLKMNSGTGSVTATGIQAGISN